jgi:hypothetical protein
MIRFISIQLFIKSCLLLYTSIIQKEKYCCSHTLYITANLARTCMGILIVVKLIKNTFYLVDQTHFFFITARNN